MKKPTAARRALAGRPGVWSGSFGGVKRCVSALVGVEFVGVREASISPGSRPAVCDVRSVLTERLEHLEVVGEFRQESSLAGLVEGDPLEPVADLGVHPTEGGLVEAVRKDSLVFLVANDDTDRLLPTTEKNFCEEGTHWGIVGFNSVEIDHSALPPCVLVRSRAGLTNQQTYKNT